MKPFLKYVSAFSLCYILSCSYLHAQSLLPAKDGQLVRLNASIEFSRGGMSGICAMRYDGGVMKGCLFNEFGISALDFTYRADKRKIRIEHVIKMLDKWYIKRVLRKDLVYVIDALDKGNTIYVNRKRHITYQFSAMNTNETER